MSAPPGTRSLRQSRWPGDADETVLCLQPDLPLASGLSFSSTSKSLGTCDVQRQLGAAGIPQNAAVHRVRRVGHRLLRCADGGVCSSRRWRRRRTGLLLLHRRYWWKYVHGRAASSQTQSLLV
ncbi:unnamed protein product [Pleuronectes platessa]|uniref:Uncharacterized protein n=1 Tax=Pleuronectes platessa TaxID=8262 RepID=A0A9N7YZN0_PLEPL|nr:unnamed protein product [Pleuronectes platessa]